MKYTTVIFDLDGTLIDSIHGIAYALNSVLSRNGFPVHSIENCKRLVGNGFGDLVRRAVPEGHRNDEEVRRYLSELRDAYGRYYDHGMAVYDGIEELLAYLQSQSIRFAIDTNKDEGVAKSVVKRFLPEYPFFCIAGTTPMEPVKPNPARALKIIAGLGVLPEQCLYLGDSEVDIKTARNAGMLPITASWGFRGIEELVEAGAEHILAKPMDLIHYLK